MATYTVEMRGRYSVLEPWPNWIEFMELYLPDESKKGSLKQNNFLRLLEQVAYSIEKDEQLRKSILMWLPDAKNGRVEIGIEQLQRVITNHITKLREPDIELGKNTRKKQKEFGERKGKYQTEEKKPIWNKWQKEANKIFALNPCLSKAAAARKIKERLNIPDSENTIRQRIVKN